MHAGGLTRGGFPAGLGVAMGGVALISPLSWFGRYQLHREGFVLGRLGRATVAIRLYGSWFSAQKAPRRGGINVALAEPHREAARARAHLEVLLCLHHPFSLKFNPQQLQLAASPVW